MLDTSLKFFYLSSIMYQFKTSDINLKYIGELYKGHFEIKCSIESYFN
jgi:hypothetical protein